jgi:GTP-binding protein
MTETDLQAENAAAALEAGRLLFARPWQFVLGAATPADLPPTAGIEVAFAGRSNVGKSSLINALTGRSALARTSQTPGRTRQVNLFDAGAGLMLADLPGYGYHRAGKREAAQWTKAVFDYLRGRPNLRRVYLLIDARHGLKENDSAALDVLDEAAVSYQIVLTKADKVKAADLPAVLAATAAAIAKRPAAHPEVIPTSAVSGAGIPELRAAIAALLEPREAAHRSP